MRRDTLSISTKEWAGFPVLEAVGEVDLLTAPLLERALKDALDRGSQGLIMDLRPTSYIDSEGIKCLIRARRALNLRKAPLWVLVPEASFAERILQITGTAELLQIRRDLHEIPPEHEG